MWIQEMIWQYLLQISLRGIPIRPFSNANWLTHYSCQVSWGGVYKNRQCSPWLIWWGWLPLIKWERGTKDTWKMIPVRRLHGTGLDRTRWEMGISGSADSCLSWTTLISAAPSPPMLAEVFTDLSTESTSPLALQVRSPSSLGQECL